MKKSSSLKMTLLMMGSFTFAFLLGEMIHEIGHFLAHSYFGVQGISIHLDPFGGSRMIGVISLSLHKMGITTAAGPGLNLAAGILTTTLLWRFSNPAVSPLLLWGPVAMIQEGVNISLGLLSPGSDAQWLAHWGAPEALLITLGVAFILAGTGLISWILSRYIAFTQKTFLSGFTQVFFGLGFLMILRAAVSLFQTPEAAQENLIPLMFALILAGLISGLQRVRRILYGGDRLLFHTSSWGASLLAVGLGLGILTLQIILP